MSDFICRRLKESDFDNVRDLVHMLDTDHAVYEPGIFTKPSSPSLTREEFRKWIRLVDYKMWGAWADDEMVGFLLLKIKEATGSNFINARRYALIDPIVVAPDWHRRGVGSSLMTLAQDYALNQDCSACELAVWEANQGALAFYEKLGFRTLQRRMIIKL